LRTSIKNRHPRKKPLTSMYPGALTFDSQEIKSVFQVMKSKSLFRYYGPNFLGKTKYFEKKFSKFMGTRFALGTSSGTAAMLCALKALGINHGDEVILPTFAWASCPNAISLCGAVPVLANIDKSLTLDPDDVEKRITKKTKAIMAVHMRGAPCDMKRLLELADKKDIRIIEDAAQCVGGIFDGKRVGSLGEVGFYSFQQNKMITCGEGGALVTNSLDLYNKALSFHDAGIPYESNRPRIPNPLLGLNFAMTEISSAILAVQLSKLDKIIRRTRRNKLSVLNMLNNTSQIEFRDDYLQKRIDGELGISLVLFMPTPSLAIKFRNLLFKKNIRRLSGSFSSILYENNRDGHIFESWFKFCRFKFGKNQYSVSSEILRRAVHIDISPHDSEEDSTDIAYAINESINTLGLR